MVEVLCENVAEAEGPDPRDGHVRQLLHHVLESIVCETDGLEVVHVAIDRGVAFQVRCTAEDVGKIIGKKGRTAQAIRTILNSIAAKNGRRYTLDITH